MHTYNNKTIKDSKRMLNIKFRIVSAGGGSGVIMCSGKDREEPVITANILFLEENG